MITEFIKDSKVAPVSVVAKKINREELVDEMMKKIDMKLDRNTCYYLLESSEWNLDTAVELSLQM